MFKNIKKQLIFTPYLRTLAIKFSSSAGNHILSNVNKQ